MSYGTPLQTFLVIVLVPVLVGAFLWLWLVPKHPTLRRIVAVCVWAALLGLGIFLGTTTTIIMGAATVMVGIILYASYYPF